MMGWRPIPGEHEEDTCWHDTTQNAISSSQERRSQQRRIRPRINVEVYTDNVETSWLMENQQVSAACKRFFVSWLRKSESLCNRWQREAAPLSSFDHKIQHLRNEIAGLTAQDTQLFHQLFALQESIDELKEQLEISSSRSSSSPSSRCSISPSGSILNLDQLHTDEVQHNEPTSIASAPDYWPTEYKRAYQSPSPSGRTVIRVKPTSLEAPTSFIRQRVSFPPSARNRCRRSQTLQPTHHSLNIMQQYRPSSRRPRSAESSHEGSSSLDSGIHTSDHEIFV